MAAQIGLQLLTVREHLARDLTGTLARVAALGYAGVEAAFFDEAIPLDTAARALRVAGLPVFAAHVPLPLGPGRDFARRTAEAFGCRRVVWHGWPRDDRYDSLDGIRRLAAEFNTAGANAAADGLAFGIHNHWWECEPVEGEVPVRCENCVQRWGTGLSRLALVLYGSARRAHPAVGPVRRTRSW